jgi:hypothetical protein
MCTRTARYDTKQCGWLYHAGWPWMQCCTAGPITALVTVAAARRTRPVPRPPSAPHVPPLQLGVVHLPHRLRQLAAVSIAIELFGPVVWPAQQTKYDKGAVTVMDGVGTTAVL